MDRRREQIVDLIEKEFIGPDPVDYPDMTQENGEEILVFDKPTKRYIAGILFPENVTDNDIDNTQDVTGEEEDLFGDKEEPEKENGIVSNDDDVSTQDYLSDAEELINRSNEYKPSAMSLTAALFKNEKIKVSVSAGTYTKENYKDEKGFDKSRYYRHQLNWESNNVELPDKKSIIKTYATSDNYLKFNITYRYEIKDKIIYTFTLLNTHNKNNSLGIKDADCFFQCKFTLNTDDIRGFASLPDDQKVTSDEDYRSNKLLYRNIKNYAIGHGCAADWDDSGCVSWVSTAIFPKYEMKPIVPTKFEGIDLSMKTMSDIGNFEDTVHILTLMCDKYREWINTLKTKINSLEAEYTETAERHIHNCEECLKRMKDGIVLLQNDENVKYAFQLMNHAMLEQQLHYGLPLRKWIDGAQLTLDNQDLPMPDIFDSDTWYGDKNRYGHWRPFQIAFILMNLNSMRNKLSKERSIVDLIWFPTGGGKTEAYLGLSAYTIFIRRILNRNDSGTTILMRYTLRLLTAQQYERASTLICACELLRQKHSDVLGSVPISIGLWVGSATTPNNMNDAVTSYNNLKNKTSSVNPFVILKCPWCGAQMGRVSHGNIPELMGYRKITGAHKKHSLAFVCSNSLCDFSEESNPLPLHVVDEAIYEKTPTLLLGTVDKFAMMPFKPQAQSLFGFKNGKKVNSPDLIIQDELHLISGPLGSMVGMYETVINELCTTYTDSGEIHPKIIGSTATISHAKEQCNSLYACGTDNVFQFPPSGIDYDDSFFAHKDDNEDGRLYVGILADGASSDATAAIHLAAGLLYAGKQIEVSAESQRDPYWTNVAYFNSIRELGTAASWIHADIDQYLDVIYKRQFFQKKYTKEDYKKKRRYIYNDKELTSRIQGDKVTESLADLSITYPPKAEHGEYPIDICLATNMISVGLDVPRLGLMTVNGQPKTTSEYIQATSRVGRNAKNGPGIVFVLLRPGRPRDKSHYELFKSYHSKIYCHVEPTSVTPFSSAVRQRALQAAVVAITRLEHGIDYNKGKPELPEDEYINHLIDIFTTRVSKVENSELSSTIDSIKKAFRIWGNKVPQLWEGKRNFNGGYDNLRPLMYGNGTIPNKTWDDLVFKVPTSMRNVDAECQTKIINDYYYDGDEDED